jgi:hypothetical protein
MEDGVEVAEVSVIRWDRGVVVTCEGLSSGEEGALTMSFGKVSQELHSFEILTAGFRSNQCNIPKMFSCT